ncbi:type I-U CRISPR-associated protein Cas8c [Thalassoglobus sp.]|uniref:type I-G CRISPR-associated protein Cas8g2 n=1 Tax=Thalassoglobus sp. TaxID=2795869 RepID=UPI003AA9AE44
MSEASIPVDLLNPGQVFACLGFLEAAEILLGNAEGGFDWTDESDVRFRLRADGEENPFEVALRFLAQVKVCSCSPKYCELTTDKWNVPTTLLPEEAPFPYPIQESPATLPVILFDDKTGAKIVLDYWGDGRSITSRDNVKFWAGSGGYPGAALARDGLDLVRNRIDDAVSNPLNLSAEQSSSFRLDWRRDYIPLDIGFSINKHAPTRFMTVGYPLVEILAAIGLTHARPEFISKLKYRYGVLEVTTESNLFRPIFLRASLGAPALAFSQRVFRMDLGWPGKEGQARCITNVYEELPND